MATWLGFSQEKVIMGFYGFNACLVGIALIQRYSKKYGVILFAILLSVLLTRAFEEISIPVLTAPFVMTIWIIIGLEKLMHVFDKE